MEIKDIGAAIATRRYFVVGDRHNETKIEILVGKPQPFPNASDFFCPVQLKGAGINKLSYAAGVDEVQALQLALKLIGAELDILNKEYQGTLRWIGNEDGDLGFPGID
ncbi:MAG TPA: hypothetical protein VK738_04870 [Terriglobales bacterium]|jgi:hypothetical protein|nr:hypothetical protein [Terriglobales bacterium]